MAKFQKYKFGRICLIVQFKLKYITPLKFMKISGFNFFIVQFDIVNGGCPFQNPFWFLDR